MMSREREQWLLDHLSDMPLRCTVSPIEYGAETIKKPVDYVAAKHTIMTSMHDRARALGWTIHDHEGDHAFLVGDPEGTADLILKIARSEEHTSELQSLMRISYAVFCLKKKQLRTLATEEHR